MKRRRIRERSVDDHPDDVYQVPNSYPVPEVQGKEAEDLPSGAVNERRAASEDPHSDVLHSRAIEEAAHRFGMPVSAIRQKVWRGTLVYDPELRKVLESSDSPWGGERNLRADSSAGQAAEREQPEQEQRGLDRGKQLTDGDHLTVPKHLLTRPLPNRNLNPLALFAREHGLREFGQITSEILRV